MPINPNIALGVQQQQPVNMLGQVGQMLALKGAVQEMQGNEDLRAAYAQGGDLNDPEFRRKVMAANPKLGSQLIKTNAETGKLQNEAIANRIKLSREMLTGVNTPEDYIAWHESNHKDPVLGSYLTQRGVTAEQSRAKIIADLAKPGGLDKLKRESALGATDLQKELMQTERTRISSGASYGQLDLAREKYKDQLAAGGDIITSLVKDPETGQDVEMQFRRNLRTGDFEPVVLQPPSMRVDIAPSSASSSFAPSGTGGGTTNVNALAPQGATAAAPNVNALTQAPQAGPTFGRPKVPFTTPVPVIDPVTGNTTLMEGKKAVATGATPATAATEARQVAIRKLPDAIAQSKDALNLIDRMVGTADGKTKPHEGFKGAVGAGMGLRFIPGTSESDFQAMYDQISGGAFLQAFNTLKGGGQITEKEGEKGTAAINRMKLATSEKEFITASRDFQAVLRRGVETAQKELRSGNKSGATDDPLGLR